MLGSERYAAGGYAGLAATGPAAPVAFGHDPARGAAPGRRALWLTIMPVPDAIRPPRPGLFELDQRPASRRSLRRAAAVHPAAHRHGGPAVRAA